MSQQAVSNDGAQARYSTASAPAEEPGQARPHISILDASTTKVKVTGDRVEYLDGGASSRNAPVGDPFTTGRNRAFGSPVAHADLTPQDIITIPGYGTDTIGAFTHAGLIEKGENGLYKVKEQKAQSQQESKAEYEHVRLSDAHEQELAGYIEQYGDTNVLGLIDSAITGDDKALAPQIADLARRSGLEPTETQAKFNTMRDAYVDLGQRVTGLSGQDYAAFTEWAMQNHGPAWKEAAWALATREDARGLKAMAQEYTGNGLNYSDAELLNTDVGNSGFKLFEDGGRVLVRLPNGDTMLARTAIANGLIPLEVVR